MKKIRQYIGILSAVAVYYLLHEGSHLLYALFSGAFKEIRFLGLGVQIDVYAQRMSEMQMGLFCLSGAITTLCFALLLTLLAEKICSFKSKLLRAILYYTTLVLLLLDPLYLSLLCGFFGGGDMNGIRLLCPEWIARSIFGGIFLIHAWLFWTKILPLYKKSFSEKDRSL